MLTTVKTLIQYHGSKSQYVSTAWIKVQFGGHWFLCLPHVVLLSCSGHCGPRTVSDGHRIWYLLVCEFVISNIFNLTLHFISERFKRQIVFALHLSHHHPIVMEYEKYTATVRTVRFVLACNQCLPMNCK